MTVPRSRADRTRLTGREHVLSPLPLHVATLVPVLIAATVALGGCAGAPPPPPPRPVAVPSAAPTMPVGPWVVRPAAEPQRLAIEQEAVITVTRDTAIVRDSVVTRATVALTAGMVAGMRSWTGSLTAWSVVSGGGAASPVALPLAFVARGAPGAAAALVSPPPAPCPAPAVTLVLGTRDLWLSLPDTVRVGTTWRDRDEVRGCREEIPVVTVSERTWVVRAAQRDGERELLTVVRQAGVRVSGSGPQSGEPVTVEGEGASTLTLTVDAATGAVLGGTGDGRLTLTLKGRLRSQTALQETHTTLLPSAP